MIYFIIFPAPPGAVNVRQTAQLHNSQTVDLVQCTVCAVQGEGAFLEPPSVWVINSITLGSEKLRVQQGLQVPKGLQVLQVHKVLQVLKVHKVLQGRHVHKYCKYIRYTKR